MKFLNYLIIALFQIVLVNTAVAQIGASGNKGTYLNYDDFLNIERTAGGDFDIDNAGRLEIGANGKLDIVGAVTNKGMITLDSGSVLTIYGDMYNQGRIVIKKGASLIFMGEMWKNETWATVEDGNAVANIIPGGKLTLDAMRPDVPTSWLEASAYLKDYAGMLPLHIQYLDGGNIAMDADISIRNACTINLINTATKIEGSFSWIVDNSFIQLNNQDLVFTKNASLAGYTENRFAVTNGTGHLVKQNYTGKWTFPVGINKIDYTPAMIENVTANTMHVMVQDYGNSSSTENTPMSAVDGIDRTWNIYADVAVGVSSVTLQHNKITNNKAFNEGYNFITRYSNAEPNLSGDNISTSPWQKNNPEIAGAGILTSFGIIAGAVTNTRTYNNFATSAKDSIAYYTKSTTAFEEAYVQMLSFTADSMDCETQVDFTVIKERKISKYQLQHSADGKTFATIATFAPKGDSSDYNFHHITAISGRNYYRIVMVDSLGGYTVSDVIYTDVHCPDNTTPMLLYPNPSKDNINISGLVGQTEIRIINMNGRVMNAISANTSIATIDISGLPAATYFAQIIDYKQKVTNIKFVKF